MFESVQPPRSAADPDGGEGEVLDAVPVPAEAGGRIGPFYRVLPSERIRPTAALGAVQAAAVAAGGFVAGAALVGLVRHHQRATPALTRGARAGRTLARGRRGRASAEVLQVVSSRSLLLDIHVLGPREPGR